MNKTFDLISIGECLVELRRTQSYTYEQSFAGDVFNSLFYASRLGLRTAFVSQFGNDHFTEGLVEFTRKEAIDTSLCKLSQTRSNGLYTVLTDAQGQPTYAFWRAGSAATTTLRDTKIDDIINHALLSRNILFSAIGLAIFEDIENLYTLLHAVKGQVRILFDMNVRPALWKDISDLKDHIKRLSSMVDVIFISSSDDRLLFGDRDATGCIDSFQQFGYKTIVYRNGASPTLAWSRSEGYIEVSAIQDIDIVDATGAGDAFNAGFIWQQGNSLAEALRFGNICGALAVQAPGALDPDFTLSKVRETYQLSFSSGG